MYCVCNDLCVVLDVHDINDINDVLWLLRWLDLYRMKGLERKEGGGPSLPSQLLTRVCLGVVSLSALSRSPTIHSQTPIRNMLARTDLPRLRCCTMIQ